MSWRRNDCGREARGVPFQKRFFGGAPREAPQPTLSRGLYRNMPEPPQQVRSKQVVIPAESGQSGASETAGRKPKRVFATGRLPCFMKLRRSVLETDEIVEVRADVEDKRQVWVRPADFPEAELREALAGSELEPPKCSKRAMPILVVSGDGVRIRALILSKRDAEVEYLDIDSGLTGSVSQDRVFKANAELLSIPNRAQRCRLVQDSSTLESAGHSNSTWVKTKVYIREWDCIPRVTLSVLDPKYADIRAKVPKPAVSRSSQKLYPGLPGLVVPPAFTLLKNCSILHYEPGESGNPACAYISRNDGNFEARKLSKVGKAIDFGPEEGDLASVEATNLDCRVIIRELRDEEAIVQCVDMGKRFRSDYDSLNPLLKRGPPRAMKVRLPLEYSHIMPLENLDLLFKFGVFDILFVNDKDIPLVRVFTPRGIEIHLDE